LKEIQNYHPILGLFLSHLNKLFVSKQNKKSFIIHYYFVFVSFDLMLAKALFPIPNVFEVVPFL
jgi:hypothetical protein